MMSCDLNRNTELLSVARATLPVTAPQQTEDKVVHSGSYRECSSAEVIKFRNGSDELLNFA
jgi:hypothetical protein